MTQQQPPRGQQGDTRATRDDRDQHQAGWTDVDGDEGVSPDKRPAT